MATGYTAIIQDKEGVTLEQFTLRCARAFGPLRFMRDDPMDAPLPEKIEPDNYYVNALTEARKELARLESLTPEQRTEEVNLTNTNIRADNQKLKEKNDELFKKYQAMLVQVEAWQPPSTDHVKLKEFMIEQLKESIKWDCGRIEPTPELTVDAWYEAAVEHQRRIVTSYEERAQNAIQQAEFATNWLNALRNSLASKESA